MSEENVNSEKSTNSRETKDASGVQKKSREDYGYDYFPERFGKQEKPIWKRLFEGKEAARSFKCVANVYSCAQTREY